MDSPRSTRSPPSLASADWLRLAETQAVLAALSAEGYEARVVGGAVRNTLLGLPVADIDIAATAPPESVTRLARAAGLTAVATGLAHGTVTVVANHRPYQVTTLRHDVETFGRHATVAFTEDWAADASRRDFTFNALYCDRDGRVLDPLGGYADLLERRVRFIGDARARIREDYLRILRYFRFLAEYAHGPADPDAISAIIAERAGLQSLSGERIRQELLRLLIAPGAVAAVDEMGATGVLVELIGLAPRPLLLARAIAVERAAGARPDPAARLAALAVAVEEDAARLEHRLRLSGSERDVLLRAAAPGWARPTPPDEAGGQALLCRTGEAALFRERILAGWARSGDATDDPRWRSLAALPDRWQPPRFPISGADIVALGVAPGPRVGRLLHEVREWWIELRWPAEDEVRAELARRAARDAR